MRLLPVLLLCGTAAASLATIADAQQSGGEPHQDLRPVSSFADISDPAMRSRALFIEAAKVITHPRCMNCHPAGDHPLQGNDEHVHRPAVARGPDGGGVAGNTCSGCHMDHNVTIIADAKPSFQSIPGHARWGLAPLSMAWEGKSVGDICRQLKDPNRNGGRSLALLHEHFASDDLVGWGWHPGAGREPAPGTQAQLGELIQAWIDTGAECPP